MPIWIWCQTCKRPFEARPSALKLVDLGNGEFHLTAKCADCSEKSTARIAPAHPIDPAIDESSAGSPFAQQMMEILREEGCLADGDGSSDHAVRAKKTGHLRLVE